MLVVVLGMAPGWSLAQKDFYIGVHGGPQFTYLLNEADRQSELLSLEPTLNAAGGGYIGQHFKDFWAFQAGFLYSKQGQRYKTAYLTAAGEPHPTARFHSYKALTYYQFPFSLKFFAWPQSPVDFIGQAGVQIGLMQDMQLHVEGEQQPDTVNSQYLKRQDRFSQSEISGFFALGGGYQLSEAFRVELMARSSLGIVDAEDPNYKQADRSLTRNFTIGVFLGVAYHLQGFLLGKSSKADGQQRPAPADE